MLCFLVSNLLCLPDIPCHLKKFVVIIYLLVLNFKLVGFEGYRLFNVYLYILGKIFNKIHTLDLVLILLL
jgi:hypothetical protein